MNVFGETSFFILRFIQKILGILMKLIKKSLEGSKLKRMVKQLVATKVFFLLYADKLRGIFRCMSSIVLNSGI